MPEFASWDAFYHSELQGWWLLWVVPSLFLAYRLSGRGVSLASRATHEPDSLVRARRFVDVYAVVFALQTLLDPFATGPLLRWLGIAGHSAGTVIMFVFVYLGDFRVFLLLLGLARPGPLSVTVRRAALLTLVVPGITGILYGALSWLHPTVHGQWQWVIYEASFFCLALALRAGRLPGVSGLDAQGDPRITAYLREVLGYVAAYYALWACSDLLILLAELDFGWATRTIANQLYYAFFVPFVWFRFRAALSAPSAR
jgi:hypothetical protein